MASRQAKEVDGVMACWHHGRLRRLSGVMPTDAFISCRDAVMIRGSSFLYFKI
jgi:hypothetical protein